MNLTISKGDFKSEDTGELLHCQNEYSKSLSWAKNLNFPPQNSKQLIQILGGKFKFSAQDSDLEYLFWQCKNSPVSSDLKPPLKMPIWIVYLNKRHGSWGWNRQHHGQSIHPTKKFTSMNLFKNLWVVTWSWSFLTSEVMEAVRSVMESRNLWKLW